MIADDFRAEWDAASNEDLKDRVFRTYSRAFVWENSRREMTPRLIWRPSRLDEHLPDPFRPCWHAISDDDLADLETALIAARRAARKIAARRGATR
ncbi:hypothetical protein [Sphingomonas sp.]|uniref:hypothetical protein n=1 Tax=Sphingomonas sp. TaxID=28214 RepID=UPI0025E013F8|nr:hypothetical protein [Sphingomonas sp.]